jgi:hypothetical protein
MITTEAMVAELPKKESLAMPGGGGMGAASRIMRFVDIFPPSPEGRSARRGGRYAED